jgi:pimeloyl-ACP methyl ester carboxylesterase
VVLALLGGLVAFDVLAPHPAARFILGLERARCGLAVKRVHVGDLDVAYLEGGAGEPLVLIHGFGADKDNFTRVAAYLTPHYRVLIPDLPAFGDSSKPDGPCCTTAQDVEWVRAFVRACGVERLHLGGSSMGGQVATEYALAYPAEVGSLWLLGPAGTRVAFDSELTRMIQTTGENRLVPKTPEEFARTMDFIMSRKPFMPSSVKRVMAERAVSNHALYSSIFEQVGPRGTMLDERLRSLATPTLVVWGKEDRALNPKAADVYEAAMPNAEVMLMDGVGHLPMVESPKEAALAYLRFRSQLGARSERQ